MQETTTSRGNGACGVMQTSSSVSAKARSKVREGQMAKIVQWSTAIGRSKATGA